VIHVLVVDDRPDVRLALLYLLEACGYSAAEAADGRAAVAYMAKNQVHVVITDLDMPGMDGLALLRIVRDLPRPRPHVIVISGSSNLDVGAGLDAARAAGADAVLTKPVSRDQLMQTIRKLGNSDRNDSLKG
jgi:two-component system chemotaxis response regulator CheY